MACCSSDLARVFQAVFQEVGSADAESGEIMLATQADPTVVGFFREFIIPNFRELETMVASGLAQTTAKPRLACLNVSAFTYEGRPRYRTEPSSRLNGQRPLWLRGVPAYNRSKR